MKINSMRTVALMLAVPVLGILSTACGDDAATPSAQQPPAAPGSGTFAPGSSPTSSAPKVLVLTDQDLSTMIGSEVAPLSSSSSELCMHSPGDEGGGASLASGVSCRYELSSGTSTEGGTPAQLVTNLDLACTTMNSSASSSDGDTTPVPGLDDGKLSNSSLGVELSWASADKLYCKLDVDTSNSLGFAAYRGPAELAVAPAKVADARIHGRDATAEKIGSLQLPDVLMTAEQASTAYGSALSAKVEDSTPCTPRGVECVFSTGAGDDAPKIQLSCYGGSFDTSGSEYTATALTGTGLGVKAQYVVSTFRGNVQWLLFADKVQGSDQMCGAEISGTSLSDVASYRAPLTALATAYQAEITKWFAVGTG